MTTSGNPLVAGHVQRLRANWPALLLPLVTIGALSATRGMNWVNPGGLFVAGPALLFMAACALAIAAPEAGAKVAPFALFGYGGYGIFLVHSMFAYENGSVFYGLVHATRPWDTARPGGLAIGLVLAQAVVLLAVGVGLLALTEAPGGRAVRRAAAQLRGAGGQPRTVPPLLLLPVIFIWEELFGEHLWFGAGPGIALLPLLTAALVFAAGVVAVGWFPRTAAITAVTGLVLYGLLGLVPSADLTDAPGVPLYLLLPLDSGRTAVFAVIQGAVLVVAGCALAPRLLTWQEDNELAERARALSRRVDGLTRSRSDATEAAVAELRRIERDLHDGAQARLVAVGMSLRAVEQLIGTNPEAARALVAEARETSSRALADLRDLVRGMYPPVLADRGLAEAVRNLALDSPLNVDVAVELAGEPPMPVAAAAYFAVAEALTNAARHGAASSVQVGLEHAGGMLRATVTDDGRGGADAARGSGLAGVERRLATFDGILAVSSPLGGLTIVAIEVPCALSLAKIFFC